MSQQAERMLVDADGAPKDRIVGFETEYGVWGEGSETGDWRHLEDYQAGYIMRYHNLEVLRTEEFKPSGDRIYLDIGTHPELSTAEETSFVGAAHRLLAGHVQMARIFNPLNNPAIGKLGLTQVKLGANTSDAAGNSWASHENYLARRELALDMYVGALVTHHMSRIVWSGAGSVSITARNLSRPSFELSEKAEHIWEVMGPQTTHSRPIVNTRDEPLADPEKFRRIHIASGESVISGFTNALRLASGSIVLRACELGVDFSDLEPENPIRAIRIISRDPSLRTKVPLINGEQLTGLELQREIAERSLKTTAEADYLTDQERYWGDQWIRLLDDLEADPMKCIDRLDWPIKQRSIERELEAKRDRPELSRDVALSKALHYHQLLPSEGLGMQLVRRGSFMASPDTKVLETGVPLPETRAKLRGEALARMHELGKYPDSVDWYRFRPSIVVPGFLLLDPYATSNAKLDRYLDRQERHVRRTRT